jgi:hypothetical protein
MNLSKGLMTVELGDGAWVNINAEFDGCKCG